MAEVDDVVAQVTRIHVRETVPDSILDHADDIEVIDLAPADLIRRLQEGKSRDSLVQMHRKAGPV